MQFGRDGNLDGRDPLTGRRIDSAAETPLTVMQREMQPGEKLVWADRPANLGSFSRQSIPQAVFGVPFLGFALFWTYMASMPLRSGGGRGDMGFFAYAFPLFGIPFILVGAGLVLSPLLVRWKARRTLYALSDRRVIVRDGSGTVTSFPLDDLDDISRRDNGDGTGDLVFRREHVRRSRGSHTKSHGFFGIAEPQRVEQAVARARGELRADKGGTQ